MKRTFLLFALSACAYTQANADLTDLWYNVGGNNSQAIDALPTSSYQSPLYTAKTGGTRVDISALNGNLSAYELIFDNVYNNGSDRVSVLFGGNKVVSGTGTVPGSEVYNIGAFTIQNYTSTNRQNFTTNSNGYYRNTVLNILGDLTAQNNNISCDIWLGENMKEVNVGGNIVLKDSRLRFGSDYRLSGLKKSMIGGNVEMSGSNAVFLTNVGGSSAMGTISNPDFKIDGIVNMQATTLNRWVYNCSSYDALYTYISVGGINGTGYLSSAGSSSGTDSARLGQSVIAFTTKAGQTNDFKGTITSGTMGGALNDAYALHLDLEMRGEEGGTQILRLVKDGSAYMDSNITVYGGTLRMYNTSDQLRVNATLPSQKYNTLIMEGGKFGATTSTASSDNAGNAYFNGIEWNSGVLLIDIVDADSSLVSFISGKTLTLGSADTYMFEFVNESGADLADFTLNVDDFLQITAGITEAQISKMSGYTSDGQWEAVFDAQSGLVSFVQVPEPSTVAAIFGALALAFAAYRRRK